ncbi:coiled-coil domain-containing protein 42 homolog isoform X1 [Ictalurus furcatus]|uniref:coiled-coil domain-containing protein 42 homolog isoform X1 n=1 Tax=Ictalurus furcatus TaxID=66913 RepID=UPI0023508132|nr:coiled-coil domain-containing protein 42 homolog isoform X1 [Ictalurus furcatus]
MSSVRKMSEFLSSDLKGFEMNRQQQSLKPTLPEDEKPIHSGRLLGKRLEAMKMQENVKLQIKEFESFQHALHERKERLKEKEQQLQHHLQTDSFLKYNEEQWCYAERKARRNRELIKKKQEYLKELNEELISLITQQEQLRKQNETKGIYAEYLDAVVKESKEFQEPRELIEHYEARRYIQKELMASVDRKHEEELKSRVDLASVRQEYYLTRVNRQAMISMLWSQLEEAKQLVLNLEATWDNIQRSAEMKTCEQTRINLTTFNMSKYLWKMGTEIPKSLKPQDTIEALDKIQEFICDLTSIWEKVSKSKSEREEINSSTKGQHKTKTKSNTKH